MGWIIGDILFLLIDLFNLVRFGRKLKCNLNGLWFRIAQA